QLYCKARAFAASAARGGAVETLLSYRRHAGSRGRGEARRRMTAILALDQGTTSSRALVFDESGAQLAMAQRELRQIFPRPGWVEHDPIEIWESQLDVAVRALAAAGLTAADVAALGITNQRETVVVWERATGRPIANALVWQDPRTAPGRGD